MTLRKVYMSTNHNTPYSHCPYRLTLVYVPRIAICTLELDLKWSAGQQSRVAVHQASSLSHPQYVKCAAAQSSRKLYTVISRCKISTPKKCQSHQLYKIGDSYCQYLSYVCKYVTSAASVVTPGLQSFTVCCRLLNAAAM